jgi:hypothetical protein
MNRRYFIKLFGGVAAAVTIGIPITSPKQVGDDFKLTEFHFVNKSVTPGANLTAEESISEKRFCGILIWFDFKCMSWYILKDESFM